MFGGLLFAAIMATRVAAEEELPVVKLSPVVRPAPLEKYADVPCTELQRLKPENVQEERQLNLRKRQCLDQYREFLPNDGLRR